MIVCSCRGISDRDYKNEKELIKRLQQKDRQCCSCLTQYSKNVCKKSSEDYYEQNYDETESTVHKEKNQKYKESEEIHIFQTHQ